MGNNKELEVSQTIGHALKKNSSLVHLDLSYNYFNTKECEIIGNELNSNHSLLGIHMLGNNCRVNAKGFVIPTEGKSGIESAHFFQRGVASDKLAGHPEEDINCWICEKWVEMTIKWVPKLSGPADSDPIFLHLECDE